MIDKQRVKKLSSIVCFRDGFTVPEKLANTHTGANENGKHLKDDGQLITKLKSIAY